LLGIRNDFAEISGSLKSGFSLISTNKAVNEISKLASNLLQFDEEDDKEEVSREDFGSGVVGVTEEALEFVKEISLRPECWIDFPLSLDDKDFDMSNAQKEHALRVEHLAPSLADLRMKLCPHHMKEETFWSIYFILLHPRLKKHDSELLSTPQILEARDVLLQIVRNRKNENLQTSNKENLSLEVNEKGNNAQERSPVQEKRVSGENVNAEHQEDVDQWLEEDVETGTSFTGRNHLGDEQDVSFSDLEDDDNDSTSQQGGASPVSNVQLSSPNDSSGWVQLSESSGAGGGRKKTVQQSSRDKDSEGEGSSEWLTIDESDSDSVGTS
ncbi:Bsd domain-containing protein, partial [Thalictrum thalictroides]